MSESSRKEIPVVLAILVGIIAFVLGLGVGFYVKQAPLQKQPIQAEWQASKGLPVQDSLAEVRDKWRDVTEEPGFQELTADDKLKRKKQFFRDVITNTKEYKAAAIPMREAIQILFFWDEVLDKALEKVKKSNPSSVGLVAEEDWTPLEQRLVSELDKSGVYLSPRIHASQTLALVYDQLAMHSPKLILLLGSSKMRDEVLRNLANGDRIFRTDLSLRTYALEPPPAY